MASIVPVASCLYLVDGTIGYPGEKTDLVGIFNTINADAFPHVQRHFVVYARLVQGLGRVAFHIEICDGRTQQLIHSSATNTLDFQDRDKTIELALTFQGVRFPHPGIFLVELYCNDQWVADARLQLNSPDLP
jgi:Family of unknown function (DUF6941)